MFRRSTVFLSILLIASASAQAQGGDASDRIDDMAAEIMQHRDIGEAHLEGSLMARPMQAFPQHVIATSILTGGIDRRQEAHRTAYNAFRSECTAKGGEILHQGSEGVQALGRAIFGEVMPRRLEERYGDRAGILLCERQDVPLGAIVAVHETRPWGSSITLLDPAAVTANRIAESQHAEVLRAERERFHEWQRTVGEGEMTSCGRILEAQEYVVMVAHHRTGQETWIERSLLGQVRGNCLADAGR